MKKMKSETFSLLLCVSFLAALFLLIFCISAAHKIWGDGNNWQKGIVNEANALIGRQQKTDYISQKGLHHNAFVIGGSKAGALKAETLNLCTGLDFYNFYVSSGNFRDYGLYIDYILNNYKGEAKYILLHLSSHEAEMFSRVPFVPFQMQKNPALKLNSWWKYIKENYLNINTFIQLYSFRNKKNLVGISSPTGERSPADDKFIYETYQNDKAKFEKDVLSYWTNFDDSLKNLFYKEVRLPACEKNIRVLRKIKSECEKNGVTLAVIIGPTFIGELYKYASPEYVEYMREIVSVCGEVWNFSGINDVNMNPYNFYNGGHCWLFTGDKMIETMFRSKNTDDFDAFGVLLNEKNFNRYIENQKEKYELLKSEYDKTGSVPLGTKNGKSFLEQGFFEK